MFVSAKTSWFLTASTSASPRGSCILPSCGLVKGLLKPLEPHPGPWKGPVKGNHMLCPQVHVINWKDNWLMWLHPRDSPQENGLCQRHGSMITSYIYTCSHWATKQNKYDLQSIKNGRGYGKPAICRSDWLENQGLSISMLIYLLYGTPII